MKKPVSCALAMILVSITVFAKASDGATRSVVFQKGSSSVSLKGQIKGDDFTDYAINAKAGQKLTAKLKASSSSCYFNVLPPGSQDAAMFIGSTSGNSFSKILPSDGSYSIRVYLMRSAARRNQGSNFNLDIGLTGNPLKPLSGAQDAKVGKYHAVTTVDCSLLLAPETKSCDAKVIRRGFDGTGTVDLSWPNSGKRSVLFLKGKPVSSDAASEMTSNKDKDGIYTIDFEGSEKFKIPESLVFGG